MIKAQNTRERSRIQPTGPIQMKIAQKKKKMNPELLRRASKPILGRKESAIGSARKIQIGHSSRALMQERGVHNRTLKTARKKKQGNPAKKKKEYCGGVKRRVESHTEERGITHQSQHTPRQRKGDHGKVKVREGKRKENARKAAKNFPP